MLYPQFASVPTGNLRRLGGLLALTIWMAFPGAVAAEILVSLVSGGYRVLTFDDAAAGDALPVRTLEGPATQLDFPALLAVDSMRRHLYVPSDFGDHVSVFAVRADGDTAPLRTIEGSNTLLARPNGVALDLVHNELFVASFGNGVGRITVYRRTADGDATPLRVIEGPAARLDFLSGIAFDPIENEIFVTCQGNDPGVRAFRRLASGNVAPLRSLGGPATGLIDPYGIVHDPHNRELVVTDRAGAISSFRRDANGNEAPLRRIAGPSTGLLETLGVALLGSEIVVVNNGVGGHDTSDDSIRVFRRDADGDVAPSRILLNGSSSTLSGGVGVAAFHEPLRLQDERFAVDVSWQTSSGLRGGGVPVALTADTGYFWFFDSGNVETVVKVLSTCPSPEPRFWVFAAGLTNVEVTTTVTDLDSGASRTYVNPLGQAFAPIQDTNAFATCP